MRQIKRGDTFTAIGYPQLNDINGDPVSLQGATARSQVRTSNGKFVADLTVEFDGTTLVLKNRNTQNWPVGNVDLDVEFTMPSGDIISTETETILVVADVTRIGQ